MSSVAIGYPAFITDRRPIPLGHRSYPISTSSFSGHSPNVNPYSEVGSAAGIRRDEEIVSGWRDPFQGIDRVGQRFSLCSRIPTLAVFPAQIFVSLCHIGDLLRLPVVQQFLASPQCDRIQVNGL